MTFQSKMQPLCRACGKPIAKATRVVRPRLPNSGEAPQSWHFMRTVDVPTPLLTKQDCERVTNLKVMAVRYSPATDSEPRRVAAFTEWDGESYVDEFFCTNADAQAFARMCARHQGGPLMKLQTKAYADALAARQQSEATDA